MDWRLIILDGDKSLIGVCNIYIVREKNVILMLSLFIF